jgi:hypothetical protein
MRRTVVYLLCLAAAALAVFLATYFLGRHSTLEAELERITAPRPASPTAGKSRGIPSLQPVEAPQGAPAPQPLPGSEPLGEGILVTRSPLEPPGMVIVADLPALTAASREGLVAFLRQPPDGLSLGLRALAGSADECGGTDLITGLTNGGAGELLLAFDRSAGLGQGPRNTAGAVAAAAADFESAAGERVVVLLAGGEEGCGADFCGEAPPPGGAGLRIHAILLVPPPPGDEPGIPVFGGPEVTSPPSEPPWAAPYRCLAERSGGAVEIASSPAQLEAALRRAARRLEAAVTVRGFHYAGREIRGMSPEGPEGWGATLKPSVPEAGGIESIAVDLFPAAFAVTAGVYIVKGRFREQEKTAAVAVAPGERAEVRVQFATGELFVSALDTAGGEIAGDSTGFQCAWGAEVLQGDEGGERTVARTCSFPARFELAPGDYRVRVRWKDLDRVLEEVTVEPGASVVRTVSFGGEEP